MLSSLQPKRPQVSQPQRKSPLNQQQTHGSSSSPLSSNAPALHKPRSQIEALPPSSTPLHQSSSQNTFTASQLLEFKRVQRQMSRDSSRVHPMFLTDGIVKKAPYGVQVGEGVGMGYVFEEERSGRKESGFRL